MPKNIVAEALSYVCAIPMPNMHDWCPCVCLDSNCFCSDILVMHLALFPNDELVDVFDVSCVYSVWLLSL
jgi:hypothetical protein